MMKCKIRTLETMAVYSIINRVNGMRYIGASARVEARMRAHRLDLIGNRHYNPRLQRDWNEFGQQCFVFEISEIVHRRSDLGAAERAQIAKYAFVDRAKLYNRGLNVCGHHDWTY